MGDRRFAAPRARHGVGQQRPAKRHARRARRLAERRVPLVAPCHDHPAPGLPECLTQRQGAGASGGAAQKRTAVRAPLSRHGHLLAHQRLAQGKVEVNHTGPALQGRPPGAAGERTDPAQALGRGRVRADLEEPLGKAAEDLRAGRSSARRRLRAARAGDRRSARSKVRAPRGPRRRPAAARRPPYPKCTRSRRVAPRPWPSRARRSRRSARPRGSGSATSARRSG